MSCNGKRDDFLLEDLLAAAKAADVKNPKTIIEDVQSAMQHWTEQAEKVGIDEECVSLIGKLHRTFI